MTIHFLTKTLDEYLPDLMAQQSQENHTAQILLVGGKHIDLDAFPALRGIFKVGVGTDNLPFEEAKQRGIEIALPAEATRQVIFRETADFACHLILQTFYRAVGDWGAWRKEPRQTLASKNLLVIGTGNIGSMVVEKMSQFCQVSTFDTLYNSEQELKALIEEADCVSLHIPHMPQTDKFIDAEKLSWMKDGAALVNTARGKIIDEAALLHELKTGRLFAALDVFSEEPYHGPLSELGPSRVLLSPHVASTCQEFLALAATDFRGFVQHIMASRDDR